MFWFDLQWKTQACNWIALLGCQAALNSLELKPSALHYYSPWRVIQTVKVKLFCGQCNLCEDLSVFQQNIPQGFIFRTHATHILMYHPRFDKLFYNLTIYFKAKISHAESPIVLNDKIGDFFKILNIFCTIVGLKYSTQGTLLLVFP